MNIPSNLRYSKTHEWVLIEGGRAKIGITDHAQSELGDIYFLELPFVGDRVTRGSQFGSVDAVKTVSELLSPLSGEVAAVNTEIGDAPQKVNEDPYGSGWLIEVTPEDPSELDSLLSAGQYEKHLQEG